MAARDVRCPSCGASVPLVDPRRARCLFCLGEVQVPPEVEVPLGEAERLERILRGVEVGLDAARAAARAHRWARLRGVVQLGCGALLVAAVFALQVAAGGLQSTTVITVGANLGIYAGIGVAMLAGWAVSLVLSRRRLERLPLAALQLDQHLEVACPDCAVPLQPRGEVTAVCGGCGVESLLPAALVDVALRDRHHRVLARRGDLGDFQAGQQRSFAVTQALVGCVYLGMAAAVAVGGVGLVGLAAAGFRPAVLAGGYALLPVIAMSAMYGWTGLGQVIDAFRTARGGTDRS